MLPPFRSPVPQGFSGFSSAPELYPFSFIHLFSNTSSNITWSNPINTHLELLRWLSGKEVPCQCRIRGFDHWVRKTPGGRNGNSLQYSCCENPIDRGAWWATVHGVTKSQTRLSKHTCTQDEDGGQGRPLTRVYGHRCHFHITQEETCSRAIAKHRP